MDFLVPKCVSSRPNWIEREEFSVLNIKNSIKFHLMKHTFVKMRSCKAPCTQDNRPDVLSLG